MKKSDAIDASSRVFLNTQIGPLEIRWSEKGLLSVRSAKTSENAKVCDIPVPKWVQNLEKGILQIISGKSFDFSDIPLADEKISPFFREVYKQARRIPFGSVLSYGELAKRSGSPLAFRAVGQAMAKNPWPFVVPCHRILASRGKLGGFSLGDGPETKAVLLKAEGVDI